MMRIFCDQPSSESESSSDEEGALETLLSTTASGNPPSSSSSDEENVESLDPADRSTASLAEALAAEQGAKKRRRPKEPTSLTETQVRVTEGCKCAGQKKLLPSPSS